MSDLGDHSPLAQPLQDLLACPVEPRLDGSYRTLHGPCNVLVRLSLLMEQQEDAAVFGSQLAKGFLDLADKLGGIIRWGSRCNVLKVVDRLWPARPLC